MSKEEKSKESALVELLAMMEDSESIIPDAVTDYYMQKAGFECSDKRISRILALATQKFISDITTDAMQFSRTRTQAMAKDKKNSKAQKTVLTMDDLSNALQEQGVNINKPEYY